MNTEKRSAYNSDDEPDFARTLEIGRETLDAYRTIYDACHAHGFTDTVRIALYGRLWRRGRTLQQVLDRISLDASIRDLPC